MHCFACDCILAYRRRKFEFFLGAARKGHYFCSQFVAELLRESGAVPLRSAPCFYLPNRFAAELPAMPACREVRRDVI